MRGVLSVLFSLSGVIFFSLCLLFSGDLVFFWLFLELMGLSLIPSFFYIYSGVSFYTLFIYIVVSSLSSSFMLIGIINEDLILFFVLGFLVKFGVFPFFGWVYSVVLGSNGLVVWLLSTFVKVPFVYICFFLCGLSSVGYFSVGMLCVFTFFLVSCFFWVYNYSWRCCWAHMMVSSSSVLVLMSFVVSLDLLFWFFFIYILWSSLTVFFLFFIDSCGLDLVSGFLDSSFSFGYYFWFGFVFLLLATPISLSLFYKVFSSFCIYSCGFFVLVFWVLYSLSEQFFFFKYLISSYVSKFSFSWFSIL
uniref:NADH dehydrogenase subunit 2 n=1 Tax=Tylodelphys immer TaxID=1702215 RepID=A0A6J3YMH8_9TREM|nr:NADH dehydrogenase subunit 2 [Tylodelphys immer]